MKEEGFLILTSRGLTMSCFAFLVAIGVLAKHFVHPDCAMYLQMAELMLDGAVPYVDFVEINPPLVIYLSAIPVMIARALNVGVVQAFNVMLALFAGYGAWALLRHLPRIAPKLSEPHRHLVACVWLGFSFLVLIGGHWSLPIAVSGTDYGQREHLVALGYVPFLALRIARWRHPDATFSRLESIASGALSGIVLCLKPQFIGAAVLVELYLLLENRRFSGLRAAEVWAACGVGVIYALHFALIPAPMRDAFFSRWLPLASSRYATYNWPLAHIFGLRTLHASVFVPIALFLPWRGPYRAIARRAAPFAIFALGSAAAMVAQHKGWPYHVIPMTAGLTLTFTLVLCEVMQLQVDETPRAGDGALLRVQRALLRIRAPALALLMGAWFASVVRASPGLFMAYRSPTLDVIRKVTAKGDAVTYLTTSVQTVFPEHFHSKRTPGSRYHWTFPIAYLFEGKGVELERDRFYDAPVGREDEEKRLLDEMVEDVAERQPKLVLIWRTPGCQACPFAFSIAAYLKQKQFPERALTGYFKAEPIGHWDVWAKNGVDLPPLVEPEKPQPE